MAASYDDCMLATAAAWTINERIIAHCQAGRMLAGLTFDAEGRMAVDGEDRLPNLIPVAVSLEEAIGPGAGEGHRGKDSTVEPTWTLRYRLSTSRREGWFRRDPTDATEAKGFMEWVALILDAIETAPGATLLLDAKDASLNDMLEAPLTFRVDEEENGTTVVAFHGYIVVTLPTRIHYRAERSSLPPESP